MEMETVPNGENERKRSLRPTVVHRVIFNVCAILALAIPLLFFKYRTVPFQQGFFCNDDSIRYPYKDSTITNVVLYIVGMCLPISAMLICETVHWRSAVKHEFPLTTFVVARKRIHPLLVSLHQTIGVFLFGAACSQMITDIAKYSIGRLRPHFMDVCRPQLTDDICGTANNPIYVTDFECTTDNEERVREARLSFLSGHASFSAYTAFFLIYYLQARLTWNGPVLFRPFLQILLFLMAFGTACSRVSDHKHHPTDVMAGMFVGFAVASTIYMGVFRAVDLATPVLVTTKDGKKVSLAAPSLIFERCLASSRERFTI